MIIGQLPLGQEEIGVDVDVVFYNITNSINTESTVTSTRIDVYGVITELLSSVDDIFTGQLDQDYSFEEAVHAVAVLLPFALAVSLEEETDTSDTLAHALSLYPLLVEALEASDSYSPTIATTEVVVSTVALTVVLAAAYTETNVSESTALTEAAAPLVRFLLSALEETSVSDTVAPTAILVSTVTESLSVSEALISQLSISGDITEGVDFEVIIVFDDVTYVGWVVNGEGLFPASKYTNWPFNSYALLGNRVYALSSSGLYELTGSDDASTEISSHILTGKMDFGSNLEKQVPEAQIGYTSDGTLRLLVTVMDEGEQKEFWYELTEVSAPSPRTNDVMIGRGLISTYWQFKLINVEGSDFHIDNIRLFPVELSRKGY